MFKGTPSRKASSLSSTVIQTCSSHHCRRSCSKHCPLFQSSMFFCIVVLFVFSLPCCVSSCISLCFCCPIQSSNWQIFEKPNLMKAQLSSTKSYHSDCRTIHTGIRVSCHQRYRLCGILQKNLSVWPLVKPPLLQKANSNFFNRKKSKNSKQNRQRIDQVTRLIARHMSVAPSSAIQTNTHCRTRYAYAYQSLPFVPAFPFSSHERPNICRQ